VNGNRSLAYTDDQKYSRDRENWEPIEWVESAKDIPREERLFDFFEPVGPTPSSLVQRQKRFIALAAQVSCDDILVLASDM
jgi:hypothetical protein